MQPQNSNVVHLSKFSENRDLKVVGGGKSKEALRTIGEVAEELDIQPHVLRFWQDKFRELKPIIGVGGRRYYRPEDVFLIARIRDLLYNQGYTIKGVQQLIKQTKNEMVAETPAPSEQEPVMQTPVFARAPLEDLLAEIADIRAMLV